jgi:poly(3-hydroxybutyrate) depolymerase
MPISDLYFSWWLRPGTTRSIIVGGMTRSYIVHVPKDHDQKTPLPVVLALHGATMNGPMMAWFSGLNWKADEAGFIAVYPNGTGTSSSFFWNGGNCCGEMNVTRTTYDGGKDGSEVVLVVVEEGGHTWPGRKSPSTALGKSAMNLSANDLMWEFFQRHKRI